jgi:hypothetical protein
MDMVYNIKNPRAPFGKRKSGLPDRPPEYLLTQIKRVKGEKHMGEKGSRDKAGREDRKKPKHTQKEKRKLKKEKKSK